MAFERVGLGGVLTTDAKPMVKAMGQGRDALGRFISKSNRFEARFGPMGRVVDGFIGKFQKMSAGLKKGAQQLGAGAMNLGMGLAPVGVGLGVGIKKAADFEKQMSAVSAITRATAEDQTALEKKAKQMGIVSAFSATQAGEGMEFMARAGANTEEIIVGLDGVMNAAAADGIDLATSADIVSRVVRGMGMEFSDATRIADTLALASSKSNTNIRQLGESFVYGASTARQAGVGLEETTALFGKMADAGLKGSLAGTAFTNMLGKLTKPSEKAEGMMKKWNISLVDGQGKLRKISAIVEDFRGRIEKIPSKADQLAAAQEIFGKRGARAYGALASAGEEATNQLEELLKLSSEGEGAAAEMAAKRLDNLTGKLTLFGSSLEGLAIGVFGPLIKDWADGVGGVTDQLNGVLFALNDVNDATKDGKADAEALAEAQKKHGSTFFNIAMGIRDATLMITEAWNWLVAKIKQAGEWLQSYLGEDGVRTLTKWVTIILAVAGALAPVLLGMVGLKFIIGGIATMLSGLGSIIAAAFWPALIVAGLLFVAYSFLRQENETFMETSARVWASIKAWAIDVYENALKPIWEGITNAWTPAIERLGEVWASVVGQIKELFGGLFESFNSGSQSMEISWTTVGEVIVAVVATVLEVIMVLIETVTRALEILLFPIRMILQFVHNIAAAFGTMFGGEILEGLARLGLALADGVLSPIRWILKAIIELAGLVGADEWIPDGVKTFAEHGITELVYGDKAREQADAAAAARAKENAAYIPPPKLSETEGFDKPSELLLAHQAKEKEKAARDKPDMAADMKELMKGMPPVELNVNNKVEMDGETIGRSTSKHRKQISDRAGFKATPWQRRAIAEFGAVPLKTGS